MTLLDTDRSTVHPATGPRTVLVDGGPGGGLVLVPSRRRDTLVAHLRAGSLDRQLATGTAAETSRLLATRAALLTDRRHRDVLARRWDNLVVRAYKTTSVYDPRVQVARYLVHAANEHIDRLTAVLRAGRPVSAGGVAAARLLLTDGTSPVYNRRHAGDALASALARVLAVL